MALVFEDVVTGEAVSLHSAPGAVVFADPDGGSVSITPTEAYAFGEYVAWLSEDSERPDPSVELPDGVGIYLEREDDGVRTFLVMETDSVLHEVELDDEGEKLLADGLTAAAVAAVGVGA